MFCPQSKIFLDPDTGLVFDEPWLVAPMHRWRLVPLWLRSFVDEDATSVSLEYEGEYVPRCLVVWDKDGFGDLSNPVLLDDGAREVV